MKKRKITFITIVCTSSWDFSYFSREAFKSSWRRRALSSWIDPWKIKSTYTAVNWNLKPHLHIVASFSSTSSCITREAFKLWTLGLRPHYAERIFKTEVSLWKHIKCFPSTIRRRISNTQQWPVGLICVWGKLGQGNHVFIVTSSFSKSYVFKMFSVHTKT